jgi:pimeloyl-ACP methyl ester carboxylesterase
VRGLIIEEIGATVLADTSFVLAWEGVFATRQQLEERVGPRFRPYLEQSFRQTTQGWKLAFDVHDVMASQDGLAGDHWDDWLASDCPALVIRGSQSRVTNIEEIEQMGKRRPNTQILTLEGGHVIHMDAAPAFTAAVQEFLKRL